MKKLLLAFLAITCWQAKSQIVMTEIMYNPPESGTDSLEFIELYNAADTAVNMLNWSFGSGVTYTFPNIVLAPGELKLVCGDSLAVINTFGVPAGITLQWTAGAISNGGEPIALWDSLNALVDTVNYDDVAPWSTLPDGFGHSLVLCDIMSDNNDGNNWNHTDSTRYIGVMVNGVMIFATPGEIGGCYPVGQAGVTCGDLFFSEYIEGSSNNKALEIYNPLSDTVELNDYVIYRNNNGSLIPTDSLFPKGFIYPGDVYVIGNSGANVAILAESDTTHSMTFYNGDDAVWLKNLYTGDTLDIIGEIGVDPGSSWTVGTGATSNFTLIRMMNVHMGEKNWALASSQWDVHPIDMTDSLGFHYKNACGATVNPQVYFSNATQSVAENGISVSVDVEIVNENLSATSVDVVLNVGSSTATNGTDFTYTSPTTVTFPGGTNLTQTVTILITDDAFLEADEEIVLELLNPTNNATIGLGMHTITILDNELEPDFGSCSNLFFSEYVEGSSNNKALEIYNPTCDTIDLSDYQVERYTNGNSTPSGTYTFPAGTLLASKAVYVIGNASADPIILGVSDTTNAATFFNGDDAMTLMQISTGDTLDIIGIVGQDPGTNWTVGSGATSEYTLIRKANIHDGTTDWSISSGQWEVLAQNTFDSLGAHWATSCNLPLIASFAVQDTVSCLGNPVCFTNTSNGGACNQSIVFDFGDGNVATQALCHNYTMSGTYNVTLTVTDGNNTDDTTVVVTVLDNSDAGISPAGPFCETDAAINMMAVDAGGTWSGTGITNSTNGTFDPMTAGTGSFDIVYTISGMCGDTDTTTISVMAIENADVNYGDTIFCANTMSAITPNINGDAGTFTGSTGLVIDGNTGVIDGISTLSGSGAGVYTVTFITNGMCSDTLEITLDLQDCNGIPEANDEVFLYPNPASSILKVQGNLSGIKYVTIMDMTGKKVKESSSINSGQINISDLAKGNYILLISTDQITIQKRFIKE